MKWISTFSLILTLLSCSESPQKVHEQTSTKWLPLVRYAQHFQVFQSADSLKLEVYTPDNHNLEFKKTFARQSTSEKRIAALSATHIGMIGALNSESVVVGISNAKYLANQKIINQVNNGMVVELGEESQIPVESIINSKCNTIVYSGFGKTFPHQKQLQQVGIDCIANYDWREPEPLGKAEWVLFFGYLLDKVDQSIAIFNSIEEDYLLLKNKAIPPTEKPTLLSGNLWGDNWHAPSGESFNAQLFKDAGANYVYQQTKGTGSQFFSLEKVLADNIDTDFWFNTGFGTKSDLLAVSNKLRLLGPFQKNQVFDYAKSGNVYWEESALYPNRVLSDLIKILHSETTDSSEFYYYSRVE